MTAKLPDTTLAAIVRDEIMNPAGGVERWLKAILPHLEEAVVVDTGSVDGTIEKLSEMQREFPHLRVYQRPFDNFANSRNYSLEQVRTRRALILDADELITGEDFSELKRFMGEKPSAAYNFDFYLIWPDEEDFMPAECALNPRLFEVSTPYFPDLRFKSYSTSLGFVCEDFPPSFIEHNKSTAPVKIKHFFPTKDARSKKIMYGYARIGSEKRVPCEITEKYGWKRFNPRRDQYDDRQLNAHPAARHRH